MRIDNLAYWDLVAREYDSLYHDPYSNAENHYAAALLCEHLPHEGKVLDIGCGTGLGWALTDPALDYTGIDFSEAMITRATRNAQIGTGPAPAFQVADINQPLPFEDGTFDGAMSLFGVLNYADNLFYSLREIARVMKPDAPFFAMLYNQHALWRRLRRQGDEIQAPYGSRHSRFGYVTTTHFYTWQTLFSLVNPYFHSVSLRGMSFFGNLFERGELWPLDQQLSALFPQATHNVIVMGNARALPPAPKEDHAQNHQFRFHRL